MALQTPDTATEVAERAINDVFLSLAEFGAKPSLKNSWLNALIVAYSNRVFDLYFSLDQAALEALPDTAVDNLERWATIFGIQRTAGNVSSGNVIATGTAGEVIGAGVILTVGDGTEYEVRDEVTVSLKLLAPPAMMVTRIGSTVTVELAPAKHLYADNVLVSVVNAVETEYNVTLSPILVISETAFTYEISGSPSSPATGPIIVGATTGVMVVDSVEFKADADQLFNAVLQFASPISGVNENPQVDFGALTGAADQESLDSLRARLLDRIQNPIAHFNVAEITAVAKSVAGVTRVFVFEITPNVGQVTVYFMRDNDTNPIPDGSEVTAVTDALEAIRPANTDTADLIVAAPVANPQDYTFSALSPDTASMRTAVEESLAQFYAERTMVGVNIDEDAYRSAIFNTVDPTNGQLVVSFVLTIPSGDLVIASNEIGTLGNVTFT